MNRLLPADPSDLGAVLKAAEPGDLIELRPGSYGRTALRRVKGTEAHPIRIKGCAGAVFDGGQRFEDFRDRANRVAQEARDRGDYPGVYPIAMEAYLRLEDCDWIVLEELQFEGCWPTAVALKDCVGVTIGHSAFREGSFAIYAEGRRTRRLVIEHCTWIQDISPDHRLWDRIGWKRVHEDRDVREDDARAYDGDFLRADAIEGDVVIRHNRIEHAFNAIHLFNDDRKNPDRRLNRNVRIYGNTFRYIRDNPIEPEYGAWDWWVFHNSFYNCHKWFSLEMKYAGHFYIFGNVGWFDDMPGPIGDGQYDGGVFKPPRGPERDGPTYVFHNSWYMRSSYIKKKSFQRFHHFNNAVHYCDPGCHGRREDKAHCEWPKPFFGEAVPGAPKDEDDSKPFTTEWTKLEISFENDMIWHPLFPDHLRAIGYPFGEGWNEKPGFRAPKVGDFTLPEDSPARGRAKAFSLELPDGSSFEQPSGGDLGAYQGNALFELPSQAKRLV